MLGKCHQDACSCPSRTACCAVVVACPPSTPTSDSRSKEPCQKCGFAAVGRVLLRRGWRGRREWRTGDVQFCWWETTIVMGTSSVVLLRVWYCHWGIWGKEKMNPSESYLMTSFNFSLAFTSELSDLGQIKKQWLFPQRSTPLPFPLARSEWRCTGLSRRREAL